MPCAALLRLLFLLALRAISAFAARPTIFEGSHAITRSSRAANDIRHGGGGIGPSALTELHLNAPPVAETVSAAGPPPPPVVDTAAAAGPQPPPVSGPESIAGDGGGDTLREADLKHARDTLDALKHQINDLDVPDPGASKSEAEHAVLKAEQEEAILEAEQQLEKLKANETEKESKRLGVKLKLQQKYRELLKVWKAGLSGGLAAAKEVEQKDEENLERRKQQEKQAADAKTEKESKEALEKLAQDSPMGVMATMTTATTTR